MHFAPDLSTDPTGDPQADLRKHKDQLRTEVRRRRATIHSIARKQAATALVSHVAALPLSQGQIVGLYWPIGTELDTQPLLTHLHQLGYNTALPRTVGAAAALRFFLWQPQQELGRDLLGFPTPIGKHEVTPDVLLVPLIAFDAAGNRLGQGAGFYDRTLEVLRRETPQLQAIGVAFACQQLDCLPVAAHDQRLDGVLTEAGYLPVPA